LLTAIGDRGSGAVMSGTGEISARFDRILVPHCMHVSFDHTVHCGSCHAEPSAAQFLSSQAVTWVCRWPGRRAEL
jgi:hypothetical protein